MRIAVIGHGASVVGRGWGHKIDGMPVVRMHNWHWQEAEDYGSRCDWSFLYGPWIWRDLDDVKRMPSRGFLVASLPGRLVAGLRKRSDLGPYDSTLLGLPVVQNAAAMTAFCDRLRGYCPSRGAASIVLAAAMFCAREIVMVGMDSIVEGKITPYPEPYAEMTGGQHGWNRPRKAKPWHDYAVERDALGRWAETAGVRLTIAGKDWP